MQGGSFHSELWIGSYEGLSLSLTLSSVVHVSRWYTKFVEGLQRLCYRRTGPCVTRRQWSGLKAEVFDVRHRYGKASGATSYMLRNRRLLE